MNQTNQLNNHINKTESFPNFSSKLPYRLCSAIASASSSDRRPSQRGTDSASQIGEQQTGSFGAPTAILRKQIWIWSWEKTITTREQSSQASLISRPFSEAFLVFFFSYEIEVWKLIYEKASERLFQAPLSLSLSKFLSCFCRCEFLSLENSFLLLF